MAYVLALVMPNPYINKFQTKLPLERTKKIVMNAQLINNFAGVYFT